MPCFTASLHVPARLRLPCICAAYANCLASHGSFRNFVASAASEAALPIQGGYKKQRFHPSASEAEKIYERSEFHSQGTNTVRMEGGKIIRVVKSLWGYRKGRGKLQKPSTGPRPAPRGKRSEQQKRARRASAASAAENGPNKPPKERKQRRHVFWRRC